MQEDDIKSILEMDQSWMSNEMVSREGREPLKPLLHDILNEAALGKPRSVLVINTFHS